MKLLVAAWIFTAALVSATCALAAPGVTLKAGTLGFGADLTVGVTKNVNARFGINSFSYGAEFELDEDEDGGGEITPELKLFTVGALLDWHPGDGGFRISGGLYLNNNKLDLTAELNDTVEINDREYTLSDLGGTVDFNSIAPYLGIGYGNAVGADGRWHFSFDLGAMFQGAPEVDLQATVSDPALQAQLDADVAAEERRIEDDLEVFKIYPVLSLGVSYRF